MISNLGYLRLLRSYALGAIGLSFLLVLPPSARADPAPPVAYPAAVESAASAALLQFTSQGHVLGFRAGEFYVSNMTYALRVEFVGANLAAPASYTAAESEQQGGLALGRVTYTNLWQGITLAYDAAPAGVVSSSYRLEAGSDPRAIRLRYNAPVMLNSDGTLTITYTTGELIESAPVAWQEVEGARVPVTVAFAPRGDREIGFGLGDYDAGQPLFIDPTLIWNTFLGGGGNDYGRAIAVDGSGRIYVAGTSTATWQGATVPVRAYTGAFDAFAAKLSSSGALMWSTFLGDSGDDTGDAIAVDGSGNVYVAGYSTTTWQGATAPVRAYSSGVDAYAAKLNSNGVLTWNTFLGDSGGDFGTAIAVDGSGNVYVAGYSSGTWQGTDPPVHTYTALDDGFAAKLNSNGALTWNTFLGGSQYDKANAIAVDGVGNVYVAGYSTATWQGATAPVRAYSSGVDAYAAKLNSNGVLTWNTFLGGSGNDAGEAIAADADGNAYVAGYSTAMWQGATGPTRDYSSGIDAFVAKLSSTGALTWNAFLGGSANDIGYGVAADGSGVVYVAGLSTATWQAAAGPVRAYTSGYDAFAARIGEYGVYLPLMIK